MVIRNLWFGSLLLFCFCYYQLLDATGDPNAETTLRLSTLPTQDTALPDTVRQSSDVGWSNRMRTGRIASMGESSTSNTTPPASATRRTRGRRGTASRFQTRHGMDWGPEIGTAEALGFFPLQMQHPQRDDIFRPNISEQQRLNAVTGQLDRRHASDNGVTVMPPRSDHNQWWHETEAAPSQDAWLRMQVAEEGSEDDAERTLQEQEAVPGAGLIHERRVREAGRLSVNRPRSGVPLSLFFASIVAAAALGGIVTVSLRKTIAARRMAAQNLSPSLALSWLGDALRRALLRDVNATPKATNNMDMYSTRDLVLDGATIVKILTTIMPFILLYVSPTAAILMFLYYIFSDTLPSSKTQSKVPLPNHARQGTQT